MAWMKRQVCPLVMLGSHKAGSVLLQASLPGWWHQLLQAYICVLRDAKQVVHCQLQARSHYLLNCLRGRSI